MESILKSKRHNPHHLKRYLKFINRCGEINRNLDPTTYTEEHHIAPKAKDLFLEYAKEPKNLINLTTRQHIVAHIMLWKIYGQSQVKALDCMLGEFTKNNSKHADRKIPTALIVRYAAKIRAESKGMSTYKDSNNEKYYLHESDPMIKELNLVGNNADIKFSEESKENLRRSKDYNRVITIYFMGIRSSCKIRELQIYLDQGWSVERTEEDREYCAIEGNKKKTIKMKGRSSWMTPNGKFFDFITSDDPRIEELGLVPLYTEAKRAQRIECAKAAHEANTDTQYYNNGTEHKKFKEDPGAPWVLGLIDWNRDNQKEACNALKGLRVTINNGLENKQWNKTEPIPEGFALGMKPQKKRKTIKTKGLVETWNNGLTNKKFVKGVDPGEGWMRGMKPRN